jgi:hypothetical protein
MRRIKEKKGTGDKGTKEKLFHVEFRRAFSLGNNEKVNYVNGIN